MEVLEDRTVPSTFTAVNALDDGSVGSLRWAVGQANSRAGADTINFDSAVFSTPRTITLAGTQLELSDTTGATAITGPAGGVMVSGGGLSRVFQVDEMVTASISGLTITGGSAASGYGGGLLNLGTTTLTDCTVSGNSGNGGGGPLSSVALNSAPDLPSVTTLINCTVRGNSSTGSGGGVYTSSGGFGGGGFYQFRAGATILTNCTVSGNTATGNGGLSNSTLGTTTVTGTSVKDNSAASGGGIANQGTLTVVASTVSNNRATGKGGGISTTGGSVTLTASVINSNRVDSLLAALGGGISCENSDLSLTGCTVNANQANGATALGGGIYALDSTMEVRGSTVNGNQANGTESGEGGGIYSSNSALTLVASKVKGNKASTSGDDIFIGP